MPKLSVCITTYNRAHLLAQSLESLLQQTRQPDELIISDDCSSDETAAVAERYATKFKSFHYHRNAKNLNMPGNLNNAVRLGTGDYIANLHDADEYAPTMLEDWEQSLNAHGTAGFVFCGFVAYAGTKSKEHRYLQVPDVDPLTPGRQFFEKYFLHRYSSIVWGTVMARRSAYERLLPFDAAFGFISDVDMWMRMCLYFDVAYVQKPLMILDNSATSERKFSWQRIDTVRLMQLTNIYRFYKDDPDRLRKELWRHKVYSQQYYLRRMAGRALA